MSSGYISCGKLGGNEVESEGAFTGDVHCIRNHVITVQEGREGRADVCPVAEPCAPKGRAVRLRIVQVTAVTECMFCRREARIRTGCSVGGTANNGDQPPGGSHVCDKANIISVFWDESHVAFCDDVVGTKRSDDIFGIVGKCCIEQHVPVVIGGSR